MEQIILTINKSTSKVTFQRLRNAPKEKIEPFNCPSKYPSIVAFYINRQNHLDYVRKQKKTQSNSEKYPDFEQIQQHRLKTKWLKSLDNLISQPSASPRFMNQKSVQEVKGDAKESLQFLFEECSSNSVNQSSCSSKSSSLRSILSETSYKSEKQSKDMPQFQSQSFPDEKQTQQTNPFNFSLSKSESSLIENLFKEEKQIKEESPIISNSQEFDLNRALKSFSKESQFNQNQQLFKGNSIQKVKMQALSLNLSKRLDEVLMKFMINPLLSQLSFIELAKLCIKLNLNENCPLDFSMKSTNSLAIIQSKKYLYQIFSKKEKDSEKQEVFKEAMIVLGELFNLLHEFDFLDIMKRFQKLSAPCITKVNSSNPFQNEAYQILKSSFDTEELFDWNRKKDLKKCRLIQILSLLWSLKERSQIF